MTDRALSDRHQAILAMLQESKALTTPMIAEELAISERLALRALRQLETRALVHSSPFALRRPGTPPLLWRLRQRSVSLLGMNNLGSHYYRIPAEDLLAYRSLEREVVRQVRARPQWDILAPQHPAPPPGETPQCLRLRALLLNRAEKVTPDLIGLVPTRCNDFVVSTAMGQAAILIPHPPRAGGGFWTRPRRPANSQAQRHVAPGRLISYSPLCRWFPDQIAAVFPDEATASPYIERIETAGLLVFVARPGQEITEFLAALERR